MRAGRGGDDARGIPARLWASPSRSSQARKGYDRTGPDVVFRLDIYVHPLLK